MSILNSLSGAVLRQAAAIKEKIETLEVELAKLTKASGVSFSMTLGEEEPTKKKGMSAAGKAKVAAGQKVRWAKVNAGKNAKAKVSGGVEVGNAKSASVKVEPVTQKKGMSAAGRAKIAAAAKERWAKVRAAKEASK